MNHRDHPFNRSTRPLLERNHHDDGPPQGDDPPSAHHHNYSTVAPNNGAPPPSAPSSTVSAPNTAQIMRGFHDFHYVPKTSFYGGYPYGSPPSPTRQQQLLQSTGGAVPLTMAEAAAHFAFSDDSGVHTISGGNSSAGSSPNTSTVSSTAAGQHQQLHHHEHHHNPPPPPPPQRYYVDDADDDADVDDRWRPYGSHIAATKGPFIFGMQTTTTTTAAATQTSVIHPSGCAGMRSKTKPPKTKKIKGQKQRTAAAAKEKAVAVAAAAAAAVDVMPERSIKCVVVGDAAVGKTNLICSYLENRFVSEHIPTASDQYNFEVTVNDALVRVTLCDTAGQDTLDALRQLSYPDSDCFVLCFSCVRPETFRALQRKWLPQLQQRRTAAAPVVVLLVGTQADLRTDAAVLGALQRNGEQPVPVADACAVAQALGGQYLETSSRYRVGVKDAFDAAIWQALLADRAGGGRKGRGNGRPLWRRMLCMA